MWQREIFHESIRLAFPSSLEQPRAFFLGFTRNYKQCAISEEKVFAKFLPLFDRPIFRLAPATWMKGDDSFARIGQEIPGEPSIQFGWINPGRGILQM